MLSQRHRRLRLEGLESRTLLAADLLNGTLTVVGTNGNDSIQVQVASAGPNAGQLQVDMNGSQSFFDPAQVTAIQIFGLKGNDTITVDDNVTVNTSISGGKGNDTIKGGSGNDTIHGNVGNDTIHGSAGNDVIFGDNGNDSLQGGADDDTVYGGNGNDTIDGGADDDMLHGDNGKDTIHGSAGHDTVFGDNGNDSLHGDDGDDEIHGGNGKDFLSGDDGDDDLDGENGNDSLYGGDDDDHLDGGNGKDDCHGGFGDDHLKGGHGRDRLDGDDGDDLLDIDDGDSAEDGIEVELDNEFKATLTGTGNELGHAAYEMENEAGQAQTEFKVEVFNLAPATSFDVVVDSVTVGQVTTDGTGFGRLKFSSHPSGLELPFPAGFPTIHLGSIVLLVGSIQGTFVAS